METVSSQDFLKGGQAKKVNEQGSTVSLDDFHGGGKIKIVSTQKQPVQQEQGLGEKLMERGKNIISEFAPKSPDETSTYSKISDALGGKILRVAGQAAGAIGDVAGEVIGTGARKLYETAYSPEHRKLIEQNAANLLDTPIGQAGMTALKGGVEMYNQWKNENPNAAKDLEAVVNVASILPAERIAGGAIKAGVTEAKALTGDLGTLIAKGTSESIPKDIQVAVEKGIQKGIKPSVAGKTAPGQMTKFYEKAKDAVSSIVTNKDNLSLTDEFGEKITGQLPKNLHQFGEAIQQTKKAIFDQYSALTKATGKSGGEVTFDSIIPELEKAANDKVLSLRDPGTAKYAADLAERFKQTGKLSADDAETFIQQANTDLQSFYKNPQYGSGSKVAIDAMVANNMRKELDSLIENATGAEYQRLKNMYGALKTIEKDVNHRALIDARRSEKGLIDMSDIFTYGDIAVGLGTGNVAQAGKGLVGKAISSWYKFRNNPNNIVKSMFGDVEKLIQKGEKASGEFVPQSATVKGIQKTKATVKSFKKND